MNSSEFSFLAQCNDIAVVDLNSGSLLCCF